MAHFVGVGATVGTAAAAAVVAGASGAAAERGVTADSTAAGALHAGAGAAAGAGRGAAGSTRVIGDWVSPWLRRQSAVRARDRARGQPRRGDNLGGADGREGAGDGVR